MKTAPTETDREAAQLFAPSGGMRAAWRGERNGVRPVWERLRDGSEATPDFYDTDDPATVGCMVAQLRAAGRPAFSTRSVLHADGDRIWRADGADGWYETEGASVVAEMRAVKGAP